MKKAVRRVLAVLLCAMLALCALPVCAQEGDALFVQVALTLGDGTQVLIPAQTVTTTLGDTVYWVDETALESEMLEALASGVLVVTDEAGSVREIPLSADAAAPDMLWQVVDPEDPSLALDVVFGASMPVPQSPEEADNALWMYGFMTPEPEMPVPETPVPETPVPEAPVLEETPAPETPVPETPVPETPVPETPVPGPQYAVANNDSGISILRDAPDGAKLEELANGVLLEIGDVADA